MDIPKELMYTDEHEWVKKEDGKVTMGITAYASEQLGGVTFVELPEEGAKTTAGEPLGSVESVKAVSDIYAPADGEISEINTALEDQPELMDTDPYGAAWICKIDVSDASALDKLMDADAYAKYLETL